MTTTAAPPSAPAQKPVKRTPVWAKILLVFLIVLVVAGAVVGGMFAGKYLGATQERDVQVVRSVKGEEQVILVTAGLSETKPLHDKGSFFGLFDIPLSDRTKFIRYDFDGKFGIEGKKVQIRRVGNQSYVIAIPKFEFLGYDNPNFSVATESNGILSWTTPPIDDLKATEKILTDKAAAAHIDGFRPLLQGQAKQFYTRIVSSIDPDAKLTFEFTQ